MLVVFKLLKTFFNILAKWLNYCGNLYERLEWFHLAQIVAFKLWSNDSVDIALPAHTFHYLATVKTVTFQQMKCTTWQNSVELPAAKIMHIGYFFHGGLLHPSSTASLFNSPNSLIMWPLANCWTLSYATSQCVGILHTISGHVILSRLKIVLVAIANDGIPLKYFSLFK